MNNSYANAGVDVEAGYEAVKRMKKHVESTYTKGVLGGLGGFGGHFEPDFSNFKRPVLVSGTDGVGTKLKLAFLSGKHDTVGIDCVAMCVNDVICAGAKPLFFLDYIACGKNDPARIEAIVSGVAEGCRQSGCALVGGETAEMPGFYPEDEYDLAGFCVGVADYDKRYDGSGAVPGDLLIGLPSSGVHSNGFSLVRKIYPSPDASLIETLLEPTRIYVQALAELAGKVRIKGAGHITGGGWIENIPRILPGGVRAVMDKKAMPRPEIFNKIQADGKIDENDMFNTFNMGAGMVVCVSPEDAEASGYPVIGRLEEGEGGIRLV